MKPIAVKFALPRPLSLAYAALTLVLALALLALSLRRGMAEFSVWLGIYVGVAAFSVRSPRRAPLAAGFLALLLGFVRTYRHGYNLDLGLGLIALALGIRWLDRWRRERGGGQIDLGGLALLSIAAWSVLSAVFAVVRIRSFAPAPGFAYHVYRFNALGLSSEEAVVRVVLGAAGAVTWFGLYEFARGIDLSKRRLDVAVFAVLLINAAALIVQRHVAPGFLHPAGMPPSGRLNGVASFCYGLGDAMLALFLLLPAWASWRGPGRALTAATLALLTYAVMASGSRSAFLTMILASVTWAALRLARLSRTRRRLAGVLLLSAAVALVAGGWVAYRLSSSDQETPLGRLKLGIEQQGFLGHVYATRLNSYPLIFRVLGTYPLSGVGAGLYPAEVDRQRALLSPGLDIKDAFLLSSYAPNQFLDTGVELGVPALLALVLVFVQAGWSAVARWRDGGSGDAAVSLATLALVLQFGPTFLNSEALVFAWLVVGRAAGDESRGAAFSGRTAGVVLAIAVVLGALGQILALPSLAIDRQWKLLRWPMNIGLKAAEPGGRWTNPEATFVVDAPAPRLAVTWHAGDTGVPEYRGEVSFYVDGALVERSLALPGRIRQSVLPLPAVVGLKRISVRVSPPFVPAGLRGGDDRRELGIFIHSVSPSGKTKRPGE